MTVDQLREALANMPGHLPVHVAVPADGSGGGADTDYLFTLDCTLEAFPSQGRMVVISINQDAEMTSRRFRWTRERYKRAHHLNRLLQRFNYVPDKPRLVERFHDLIDSTPGMNGTDPLTLPLRVRHWDRCGDSDIPF